ncbi:MAG: Sec-independent protein translocase protein TatB [Steroidobacteraceae bacterium]
MFEIGFSEVLLIFVIALVVLGPERLPKFAAQVGRWAGRAKSMARQFREQLESEVDLEAALTPKAPPKTQTETPAPDPVGAEPELPAEPSAPVTADDYSAAHDPTSPEYYSPAHVPVVDAQPAEAMALAEQASTPQEPPNKVDAFKPETRTGERP